MYPVCAISAFKFIRVCSHSCLIMSASSYLVGVGNVNPVLLDDLDRSKIGGLYDPALGPSEKADVRVYLRWLCLKLMRR
jgi:hypothetical protein